MTDPTFIAAAYTIALGGLVLYVVSIARRLQGARRTAEAIERERRRAAPDVVAPEVGPDVPRPDVEGDVAGSDVLQATWDGR